jgi:putative membrane protein
MLPLGAIAARGANEWTWEPGILVPLLVSGVVYARGVIVLRARGARGGVRSWNIAAFAAGWLTIALALLSPLHEASEQIFTAHMIQHELLMVVAAPLIVLGRPVPVMLWAFSRNVRRRLGSASHVRALRAGWTALTRPVDAWVLYGVVIWVWHIPAFYDLTLRNDAVHALQHLCFLGSALLFWWSVLHGGRRAAAGTAVILLFTTAVHTSVLGALMTFSRTPWYPPYAAGAAAWGLTPIGDQQLAGLIMWIPLSVVYLVAALAILRRWIADSEWTVAQRERAVPIASPR